MTEAKRYAIVEVFQTIQGEGFHAGTPAVFVRLAGCNQWSGRDQDRQRDAERNGSACPRWCDTDFRVRGRATPLELADLVFQTSPAEFAPLVVVTGGEPMLQLEETFTRAVQARGYRVALETNGTVAVPDNLVDWITVSPKVDVDRLAQKTGHELKVVFPAYDPHAYVSIEHRFIHRYVQPEAFTHSLGTSVPHKVNTADAVALLLTKLPRWKLSLQTHKYLGIR